MLILFSTGEKAYQCPDVDTSSGETPVPCDYKTNDPAALAKHRKKIHDYVPPLNRTGPKCPRKPLETKDDNVVQPRRSPRCHTPPSPRRKTTRAPRTPKNPKDAASVTNPSPLRNEIIDVDAMDVDDDDVLGADLSGTTLFDSEEEEMSLDMHFDPTLSPGWLAKYEETCTTFEPYVPKWPRKVSSPVLDRFDMDMRREGCLCPEWMEEAGIDGWSKSAVEDAQEIEVL